MCQSFDYLKTVNLLSYHECMNYYANTYWLFILCVCYLTFASYWSVLKILLWLQFDFCWFILWPCKLAIYWQYFNMCCMLFCYILYTFFPIYNVPVLFFIYRVASFYSWDIIYPSKQYTHWRSFWLKEFSI